MYVNILLSRPLKIAKYIDTCDTYDFENPSLARHEMRMVIVLSPARMLLTIRIKGSKANQRF